MACKRSSVRARLAPLRKLLQMNYFLLGRLSRTGRLREASSAHWCPNVPGGASATMTCRTKLDP